MKTRASSDDVFFFTLIDFLLQVFFFGLVVFVLVQAYQTKTTKDKETQVAKALQLAGVSNLRELTDELTRLGPLKPLIRIKALVDKNGGPAKVEGALKLADKSAGTGKAAAWGKPSCLKNITVNGQERPPTVARAVITDTHIALENPQPELTGVLSELGLQYQQVKSLDLGTFRRTFAPLAVKHPDCMYFVSRTTNTRLLEPLNALWSAFRTN